MTARDMATVECLRCHESGHDHRDCPALAKYQQTDEDAERAKADDHSANALKCRPGPSRGAESFNDCQEEVKGLTGAEVGVGALGDDDCFECSGALRCFEDFVQAQGDDEDIAGGDWIPT